MSMFECTVVQPISKGTALLIFLHGLGGNGLKWSERFKEIQPNYMKIICPTANLMSVTAREGESMPAWFNIDDITTRTNEDETNIKLSSAGIHGIIRKEIDDGIPSNRIMLGGFSQGGAMSLFSGLTFPETLGGIFSVASWIPLQEQISNLIKAPKTTPIHILHGDQDTRVPLDLGVKSLKLLMGLMENVQFKQYNDVEHSLEPEMYVDIRKFIDACIPGNIEPTL